MANHGNVKSKKRVEVIRSMLGNYLKQRNYAGTHRNTLNDSLKNMEETIKNEVTRSNSFSYSNCFCLNNPNNHPGLVDQQFSKIQQFIQSRKTDDLQQILAPLMCHLYVEMLKGQEWKAAIQFLRKNASLVGHTESSFAKVNGTVDETLHPITFVDEAADTKTQMFRNLVSALSTMRNLQDLEEDELVANFRSCKYQIALSDRSIAVLKAYLAKSSHVVIIQTLQIWFHIDTTDDKQSEGEDEVMEDSYSGLNGFSSLDDLNDISKFTNLLASPKSTPVKVKEEEPVKVEEDVRLKTLQVVLERMESHQHPTQIFCVRNSDQFCTADTDPAGCHIACAFENSSIVLWSADRSTQTGRKPYSRFATRSCEWSVMNATLEDDGVSSDEEDSRYTKFKRKKDTDEFMSKRCWQNTIDEVGGYTLRGHGKAVTDVLFSKFSPLLLSTSRDHTMRAWRASDYSPAAVYRGHNYPLWCVAESSTGLYLATGSRDSTARLWSTEREFPLQIYVGHTQDVTTVAFHPNGNYLATGSVDLTVRLWDVTSGKLLRVFTDAKLPVHRVAFSPNGKFLAAAGEESRVRVFDIAGGTQLCELKDHPGAVTDVVWKQDSWGLATATNNGVIRMYDLTNFDDSKVVSPSTSASQHHPHASLLQQSKAPQCKKIVKLKMSACDVLTCIGSE